MRSPKGFYGAIALLLLFPIAIVSSVAFGDEETGLHLALAAGAFLLAAAVFDFNVPKRANQVACISTALLAAIFMLQAISPLTTIDGFYDFSYDTLGQWLEGTLTLTFVAWCFVMLLSDTQGTTRLYGLATVPFLLVYAGGLWATNLAGVTEPPGVLKLLFLPVMVWLLLESRKPDDLSGAAARPSPPAERVCASLRHG